MADATVPDGKYDIRHDWHGMVTLGGCWMTDAHERRLVEIKKEQSRTVMAIASARTAGLLARAAACSPTRFRLCPCKASRLLVAV